MLLDKKKYAIACLACQCFVGYQTDFDIAAVFYEEKNDGETFAPYFCPIVLLQKKAHLYGGLVWYTYKRL